MKYLAFIYIIVFVLAFLFTFKMLLSMNIDQKFKQGRVQDIRFYYIIKSFIYGTLTALGVDLIIYSILTIFNIL